MDIALTFLMGVGLSAACGFRVFVPLLVMSVASHTGHLDLAESFAWMGTKPAVIVLSIATTCEVAAYYIPWVDNLLDTVATPLAVAAGVIATASAVADVDPLLRWTAALIAGGGAAGLVQFGTVAARGVSTATTGGLGNPLFSTMELGSSITTAVLSILAPVVALVVLLIASAWLIRKIRRHPRDEPPEQLT